MANNDGSVSFDDLRVFLAVVEAGGFREAARRLGLSPSTVSETVSRLEAQLGVPLLARTTRSVMPTEAGGALAGRLTPLFGEALAATSAVATSKDHVRGRLKLNVPGAVMRDDPAAARRPVSGTPSRRCRWRSWWRIGLVDSHGRRL